MDDIEEYSKIQAAYQELFKRAASLNKAAMIYPEVFKEDKFLKFHGYFDRILYSTLHYTDLVLGLKHLHEALYTASAYEQRYYARILSLTIWNILEVPSKVMDKISREYVKTTMGDQSVNNIQKYIQDLKIIKDQVFNTIEEIRHNTIAHKEKLAIKQVGITKAIEPDKIYNLGYSIHTVYNLLIHELIASLKNNKS